MKFSLLFRYIISIYSFFFVIYLICRKKSKTLEFRALPKDKGGAGEGEPLLSNEGTNIAGETSFAWPTPPDASTDVSKSPSIGSQPLPPPPPPPPTKRTTDATPAPSRDKRRVVKKTKQPKGEAGDATYEKIVKDALLQKTPKTVKKRPPAPQSSQPAPPPPPAPQGDATYEEMVGFQKASLKSGSGKIKDAQLQKTPKTVKKASAAPPAPQGSFASPPPPPPPPPLQSISRVRALLSPR